MGLLSLFGLLSYPAPKSRSYGYMPVDYFNAMHKKFNRRKYKRIKRGGHE